MDEKGQPMKSVPYAFCCAQGGGDPKYCDCVKKDHGTALIKASCIIPNCRRNAPADEPFCSEHRA